MAGSVGNITTDIIKSGLVFNMDAANRASTIPNSATTKAFNTIDTTIVGTFNTSGIFDSSTITPSFAFDATGDDRINIGNPTKLRITTAFSVSAWIKQTTQQDSVVISKDAFSTNRCWTLWSNGYQSNNFVNFTIFDSSNTFFTVLSDIRVDDSSWHQLTAVYEPSIAIRIYIDGSLNNSNTTSIPSSIANKTVDIIIGESNTSGYYEFPGNIGPIQIYNRALSANEVLHNYNTLKLRFGL